MPSPRYIRSLTRWASVAARNSSPPCERRTRLAPSLCSGTGIPVFGNDLRCVGWRMSGDKRQRLAPQEAHCSRGPLHVHILSCTPLAQTACLCSCKHVDVLLPSGARCRSDPSPTSASFPAALFASLLPPLLPLSRILIPPPFHALDTTTHDPGTLHPGALHMRAPHRPVDETLKRLQQSISKTGLNDVMAFANGQVHSSRLRCLPPFPTPPPPHPPPWDVLSRSASGRVSLREWRLRACLLASPFLLLCLCPLLSSFLPPSLSSFLPPCLPPSCFLSVSLLPFRARGWRQAESPEERMLASKLDSEDATMDAVQVCREHVRWWARSKGRVP